MRADDASHLKLCAPPPGHRGRVRSRRLSLQKDTAWGFLASSLSSLGAACMIEPCRPMPSRRFFNNQRMTWASCGQSGVPVTPDTEYKTL
eukprot:350756-Amphidinium_carterae.1